jgi:Calponin homology (CH) domain
MNINMYDPAGGPGAGPVGQQQQVVYGTDYYDPYGGGSGGGYDDYYDEEGEEEMPTERELAEDAQWKLIQKNTFTRWANEHLKLLNKNIADLEFDLSDGLRLIALVEVLSGKKFPKFNRRPNFRTQKLENVTMCLQFLEQDEGIKIVNIGKWIC